MLAPSSELAYTVIQILYRMHLTHLCSHVIVPVALAVAFVTGAVRAEGSEGASYCHRSSNMLVEECVKYEPWQWRLLPVKVQHSKSLVWVPLGQGTVDLGNGHGPAQAMATSTDVVLVPQHVKMPTYVPKLKSTDNEAKEAIGTLVVFSLNCSNCHINLKKSKPCCGKLSFRPCFSMFTVSLLKDVRLLQSTFCPAHHLFAGGRMVH